MLRERSSNMNTPYMIEYMYIYMQYMVESALHSHHKPFGFSSKPYQPDESCKEKRNFHWRMYIDVG